MKEKKIMSISKETITFERYNSYTWKIKGSQLAQLFTFVSNELTRPNIGILKAINIDTTLEGEYSLTLTFTPDL
jgi:hypothetical protein